MQNGEKLTALESIIFNFAQSQFSANNVSPLEARLIMEAVDGKFQKIGLESVLMGMVHIGEPDEKADKAVSGRNEKHTGTPEDLVDAFKKTGFTQDDRKGK